MAFRWLTFTFITPLFHRTRRQNQYQWNQNKRSYQLFHPAFSSKKVLIPSRALLSWNHFKVCFLAIFLQQFNHFLKVSYYNGKNPPLLGLNYILQGIIIALFIRYWPLYSARNSLWDPSKVAVSFQNRLNQLRNRTQPFRSFPWREPSCNSR